MLNCLTDQNRLGPEFREDILHINCQLIAPHFAVHCLKMKVVERK